MGMDLYGLDPKINESSTRPKDLKFAESTLAERDIYFKSLDKHEEENPGIYFRASVWSWRPIYDLIIKFCEDYLEDRIGDDPSLIGDLGEHKPLIDEETLSRMSLNDGVGPNAEACEELAKRFNNWLEHNTNGYVLDSDCQVEIGTGRFVDPDKEPDVLTESSYGTSDEHLKRFVKFLENCGGFHVH